MLLFQKYLYTVQNNPTKQRDSKDFLTDQQDQFFTNSSLLVEIRSTSESLGVNRFPEKGVKKSPGNCLYK